MSSRAQIIATVGKIYETPEIFEKMTSSGLDIVRMNFSWGDLEEKKKTINFIRETGKKINKKIPIIEDLPGPRIQNGNSHTYDQHTVSSFTDEDKKMVEFGIDRNTDFIALSFVGGAKDVIDCKDFIKNNGGFQKVIAKIERKVAFENIDDIIKVADAIMVARGDLGNEFPLEQIPFIQSEIIKKCKIANKSVIVATQMMMSMVNSPEPTRAEVTDVSMAITEGADAVMLSDETAVGKYPVEVISMMEKIILEAEHHLSDISSINSLTDVLKENRNRGKLVVVRHQESEWNKLGQWTGTRDVHLTPYGFKESSEMGELLKDICFDQAFASMQVRSIETLSSILSVCMADGILPTEHISALNERDYGDYTGKNKWEMEKLMGEKQFEDLRRGWDCPVPNGESLKMVYERAVAFFLERVVPLLNNSKNVLVVSHGNTIRSLMKYIENISEEKIADVEMPFTDIFIYDLDEKGHMINKEVRSLKENK